MSYEEAIDCDDLIRSEVLRELRRHGADVAEFDADVQPDAFGCYRGDDVLGWLGY